MTVDATRLGGRSDAGLQVRAALKLAEVDLKLADSSAVRETLCAALDAGCDDLLVSAESPCCPLPFNTDVPAETSGGTGGCR